ncbi:MAG: hypothetical protein RLZ59_63, partial [Pseudomonadota bacterium]
MTDMADFTIEQTGPEAQLRFTGRLTLSGLGVLPDRLDALHTPVHEVNLSGVARMDTVGAWIFQRFFERTGAKVVGACALN